MPPNWTEDDVSYMRRAIALSARGFPAPNPHVGCVLVRGGEIIGEGWHEFAGGPHAEVNALSAAQSPVGATAYVTLEPCNHQGRTGPCSLALIKAGVKRVVYASPDPNPKAVGGGARLREAGVDVSSGLLEDEAAQVNHQFHFAMAHQRPFVVLKAACSLDGRIALPNGESKWITGELARHQAHVLRAQRGAVLVGRRTVEVDDPQLTARIEGVQNQPVRVVLDPSAKLDKRARVFDDQAETIHVTGPINLPDLLQSLFARGINGLLVEGGATTIGSFVRAGLFDQLELFFAPKLLGSGPSWLSDCGLESIPPASQLRLTREERLGDDLWLSFTKLKSHQ